MVYGRGVFSLSYLIVVTFVSEFSIIDEVTISHIQDKNSKMSHPKINNHIKTMESDFLYHLGFGTADNLPEKFGDVRYVIMGGSNTRMELMAYYLQAKLQKNLSRPTDLAIKGGRYSLYKVGPCICVNHNIGASTLSVVLHEISKLIYHAGIPAELVHFIRLGTSGGIGVEPGTVVIATGACDSLKRTDFHTTACGKVMTMPMVLDNNKANEIHQIAKKLKIKSELGKTMGTDDFYLAQGRLDGYFCDYNVDDKMKFLEELHEFGVRNIEMEAHILSAFTFKAGFKCSIVCCALLNRLNGDQVLTPKATMKEWESYPLQIVSEYVRDQVLGAKMVEDSGNVSDS